MEEIDFEARPTRGVHDFDWAKRFLEGFRVAIAKGLNSAAT